jgi:Phage portal protein, lambda family
MPPLEGVLLDQFGKRMLSQEQELAVTSNREVQRLRRQITGLLKARYEAAQTTEENENHWRYTDLLDPHAANTLNVRRVLRIRSRYEIIENNPYLKGCILSLANDFCGNGPSLKITEEGWDAVTKKEVEFKFQRWWDACGLTQKLWRAAMAKRVDGEAFKFAYTNNRRSLEFRDEPVSLDYYPVETDRVTSPFSLQISMPQLDPSQQFYQVDGVRWDKWDTPIAYNLLPYHPGTQLFPPNPPKENWCDADLVTHWFRQDRGWLRGIPELTPSLPLCALLRRYTLAVVAAAEIAASLSVTIESDGPGTPNQWGQRDDPFDSFPIERGMMTRLPWGYKMKQMVAEQPIQMYDMFVGALLREILRPVGMTFGYIVGTNKDSNMASAVVDVNLYRGSINQERITCTTMELNPIFCQWYQEARLLPGYLNVPAPVRAFPTRKWRWDRVGLDHTDPQKVMQALQVAKDKGFLTDADVQETYFNRDVEEWRKEIQDDNDFRKLLGPIQGSADEIAKTQAESMQDDTTE